MGIVNIFMDDQILIFQMEVKRLTHFSIVFYLLKDSLSYLFFSGMHLYHNLISSFPFHFFSVEPFLMNHLEVDT